MKNAIVFNPAKLNSKYYDGKINNYNKTLNAFVVSGDILNVVFGAPQSGINKISLSAQSEKAYRYSHSRGYDIEYDKKIFSHSMRAVIKALE